MKKRNTENVAIKLAGSVFSQAWQTRFQTVRLALSECTRQNIFPLYKYREWCQRTMCLAHKQIHTATYCDRQRKIAKGLHSRRWGLSLSVTEARTHSQMHFPWHPLKGGMQEAFRYSARTDILRARSIMRTKSILYIRNAGGFIQELFSILWASHKSNRWQKTFLSWLTLAKVVTRQTIIKPWAVAN